MTVSWYFVITSLTTVGFGDYFPITATEKIIVSLMLIFGVGIFSFIIGNLIEILTSYSKIDPETIRDQKG